MRYFLIGFAVLALGLIALTHPALSAITIAAVVAAVYAARSDKPSV